MARLLHEFWRNEDGGEFGPVRQASDEFRAKLYPDYEFVFEIWAESWREAMRLYEELAYKEFGKSYDDIPNPPYTEEEADEQRDYMQKRPKFR